MFKSLHPSIGQLQALDDLCIFCFPQLKNLPSEIGNLKNSWTKENSKGNRVVKDNVILVDADGVLLDWEWAFNVWMGEQGFERVKGYQFVYDMGERYGISKEQVKKLIKIFNNSAHIGFLPALRDAMFYVKRLHEEHGYVFHCITSLSEDKNAGKLRKMNLRKLFGKTAFQKFIILPILLLSYSIVLCISKTITGFFFSFNFDK